MKQEHLQIIEKSILNDKDRLKEVDNKQEIENIDKMLAIFKNYETELVNLNLELLKPYLDDKPDVFVTLEFIQCLLLGNMNNQLNFELDEEQRGLLVWICKMLETKRQELSLQPKLSSEEKYQIEKRLKINQETYDILLNKPDVYLSADRIASLASTISLDKEELCLFYQDLIERNNCIYLKEKEINNKEPVSIKVPEIELSSNLKEEVIEPLNNFHPEMKIVSNNELDDEVLEEVNEEIDDLEEYYEDSENHDLENQETKEPEIISPQEDLIPVENSDLPTLSLEDVIENEKNVKSEPLLLKDSRQILKTYNLESNEIETDEIFEDPLLQKLNQATKNIIVKHNLHEHVKEIIATLKEYDFMKITDYLLDDMIIYSSKQVIDEVFKIASQEKISKRILEQIPSVFLKQTSSYQEENNYGCFSNFINNIKILKENNIEISKVIKNSLAILTINSNKLLTNLKVARLYKIPFINKANHEEYSFLLANNLADNMDRYIEVGLEIYAKEKTAKLINPNMIMFYRLYYANQRHLQYICQFEKDNSYLWLDKEIGTKNGFGINEDNYLEKTSTMVFPKQDMYEQIIKNSENVKIDKELLNHPWIKLLEQYRFNNQNYYQINSIKISRLKVLRLFNNLIDHEIPAKDALLYAILYNTILNEKQFNTLRQAVDEICEEKVR